MKMIVALGDREIPVELHVSDAGLEADVDGTRYPVDCVTNEATGLYSLIVRHASWTYACRFEGQDAVLSFHDRDMRVRVETEREQQTRLLTGGGSAAAGGAHVKSVMPGVVKEVRVAPGDAVAEGTPLLILEAMKMENEIRAPSAGRVEAVHVKAGDAVDKRAPLVDLAPPEPTGA